MAGLPGAVAAAAGTVLPTTVLMLVMIVYFFRFKDSTTVQSMLRAVRPVVVGLLLWTAYDMAATVFGFSKLGMGGALTAGWDKLFFVLGSFAVLTLTPVNPVFVILGAALLGTLLY